MSVPPWATQRAPLRAVPDDPPADVRVVVRARAGRKCECCGVVALCILHHRRPKGMGGSNATDRHSPQNLVSICHSCHDYIHRSGDTAVYDNGWLVKQGANPARIPVTLHDDRTVFLSSDGRYECIPDVEAS